MPHPSPLRYLADTAWQHADDIADLGFTGDAASFRAQIADAWDARHEPGLRALILDLEDFLSNAEVYREEAAAAGLAPPPPAPHPTAPWVVDSGDWLHAIGGGEAA